MMELMVSVEISKERGSLHCSIGRIVHAPVEMLIRREVGGNGEQAGPHYRPSRKYAYNPESRPMTGDNHRTLPPFKKDEVTILWSRDVVAMIAAKDAVMEHVLSLHKAAQPMHEPTVQRVLEKVRVHQGENDDDNADQYARDVKHFCCKTSDRNRRR
jgi:hypothetical protein